jgi:type I restriction enzyme S subunit
MNVNRGREKSNILPRGWRWVELGEVCEVATGGTPNTGIAEYYGGNIAWMKSGDVKGTYIDDATHQISEEGLQNSNARVHPRGTVLLAMSGQGKTRGLSAILRIEAACSQSVAAILPNEYLLPEIIHYWLMAHYDDTRGITGDNERSGLNLRLVRNIFIPIPPLSEQKRIAAILNDQMAAVEKARAAAEAQLETAKALPAAYLRQIFPKEGRKLPQGWRWVGLGEVVRLVNGNAYRDSDWSKKGIPIVRIQNLNDASKPFNYWDGPLYDRVIVKNCDVLFAWSGTPGTSFGAHLWMRGDGVLNQHIFRVDLDTNSITSHWCVYAINQQLDDMISKAHGGVGLRHVTKNKVETLRLFLPPLPEQKRIAAVLDDQMSCTEKLRNDLKKQLHEINSLPAALLKRAFRGEL